MADTKVSGLALAASFLTTHEIPVNEGGTSKKINGAQIKAALPQGRLASAIVTSAQSLIPSTATDLVGLTITFTPVSAGRQVKVTAFVPIAGSVAADSWQCQLMEGATQLALCKSAGIPVGGQGSFFALTALIVPTAAAHTYKLTTVRIQGTGTLTVDAAATQPALLLAEDIGT